MNFIDKDYQINNLEVVFNSTANYEPSESYLLGYMYVTDGHYRTFYLKNSIENIICFLLCNDNDKLICDMGDEPILFMFAKNCLVCSYQSFASVIQEAMCEVLEKHVTLSFETIDSKK